MCTSHDVDQKWRTLVECYLRERDSLQKTSFSVLIEEYRNLLQRESSLKTEILKLSQSLEKLRSSTGDQPKSSQGPYAEGSDLKQELVEAYKKVASLQSDLRESERDRNILCERINANFQELEQLKKKLREADEELKRTSKQLKSTESEFESHRKSLEKAEESLRTLQLERNELLGQLMSKSNQNVELANKNLELQRRLNLEILRGSQSPTPSESSSPTIQNVADKSCPPSAVKHSISGQGELFSVAFNNSGQKFLSAGAEKNINLWDTVSGSFKASLIGATQTVMSATFSSDDQLVLGCSNDHSSRVWDCRLLRLRHTLNGHSGNVFTGTFTTDSHKAVTGSYDRTIKIWDLIRGYNLRTLFSFSFCNTLCLSSDGFTICSGHYDSRIRVWDIKNGEMVCELSKIHDSQITSITFVPESNGTTVLTNSRDNTLKLVDISMQKVIHVYQHDQYKTGVSWAKACCSPDGNYVASGSANGNIFVWHTKTEKLHSILKKHENAVTCVSWNPKDMSSIVSCDRSGVIHVWN
ncbi:protein tipD-like [Schistocerca gregaria]|uniref:protein tipD-like n=1 Tax=Schistocerca gregaria TaxID=7010 RepID=UPI00211EEC13|nr:protein tipD-like [Schistocerca gregaria]